MTTSRERQLFLLDGFNSNKDVLSRPVSDDGLRVGVQQKTANWSSFGPISRPTSLSLPQGILHIDAVPEVNLRQMTDVLLGDGPPLVFP